MRKIAAGMRRRGRRAAALFGVAAALLATPAAHLPARAETPPILLVVEVAAADPSTVMATVSLQNVAEPPVGGIQLELYIDDGAFTCAEITPGPAVSGATASYKPAYGRISFAWEAGDTPLTEDTRLFTARLPVKAAAGGAYPFTLRCLGLYDDSPGMADIPCITQDAVYIHDPASLIITPFQVELAAGQSYPLTANQPVDQWESTDETVARVDGAGRVTGLAPGSAVVLASNADKTAACTVTVADKRLTGLTIEQPPDKVLYRKGEPFARDGLVAAVHYDDGSSLVVPDVTVSGYDPNQVGRQTLTVSYGGLTAAFAVEVRERAAVSLTVLSAPRKTTYWQGEPLDLNGGRIRVGYDDGTSAELPLSAAVVEGYQPDRAGVQRLTVRYGGGTAALTVTVKAKELTGITVKGPAKTTYLTGDTLDTAGLVVTAQYNDGSAVVVSGWSAQYDFSRPGTQTVTILYGGKRAAFTVTVQSRAPEHITSGTYTIGGGFVGKVKAGSTVNDLLGGLNEKSYCKVFKAQAEMSGNTRLGTGMTVKLLDGHTVKQTLTIVVTGDTTGDGEINALDLLKLKRHILGIEKLAGANGRAGDVTGDGQANALDLLKLKRHILGIEKL